MALNNGMNLLRGYHDMMNEIVAFSESYVFFGIRSEDAGQIQRMTVGSIVTFEGGGEEPETIALCDDLLGGRIYEPEQLIQTPTYGYRMIYARGRYAMYREYSPPRGDDPDSFGATQELFTDSWLSLRLRASSRLVTESEVRRAVASGARVNALVSATVSPSGRRCHLQFPIRYFSVRGRPSAEFHAEAGPILLPRSMCGEGESESVESMCIAQIAFNRWDEAELAIWSSETGTGGARSFRDIRTIKAEFSFLVDHGTAWP